MKRFFQFVLILLLLVVIGCIVFVYCFASDAKVDQDINLEISEGSSTYLIASQLEDAGLIKNAEVFRLYAKKQGIDQRFQAGTYVFPAGEWSLGAVCDNLLKGGDSSNDVRVTIIEGLTADEIFQTLEDAGLGSKEAYLAYSVSDSFSQYPYIPK